MSNKKVFTTLGASNHVKEDREKNDYYATDTIAVTRLLEQPYIRKIIDNNIWECACGQNHLAYKLKENGFNVRTSDLVDRGVNAEILDFLNCNEEWDGDILTNPPYKYAGEFVKKALDILKDGKNLFMFLKIQFLEGQERWESIFNINPPKYVVVFSKRVVCAKNGDFEAMKLAGGSAIAFAWYVWEKGYKGDTIIKWIKPYAERGNEND